MSYVHPLTGEVLPDDLDELMAAYREAEDHIGALYAELRSELRPVFDARDRLRVRIFDLAGPAVLPRRSNRTDTQLRVSNCPRCGDDFVQQVEVPAPAEAVRS